MSPLCRAKKKIHNFHHAICTHKEIYCVFFYHTNLAMNHCFLLLVFLHTKKLSEKTSLYCVLAALSVLSFRSLNRAYFIGITSILSVCSSALYVSRYIHTRFFCSIKMFRRYVQCTTYISWP